MSRHGLCASVGFLALTVGFGAMGGAAFAQQAQGDSANQLQEVVVVARRTEEKLQSVPLSVTAVTPTQLQSEVIQSGVDLQKIVPSLSTVIGTQATGASYSLRGIRDGVTTYLGDVPASGAAVNLQLFDLQSVQAIAGPQGTLFGRNSTGGAVLFIPQKPTNKFEGSVEAGYGNYNRREITGVLNAPLSDMLQVRLDAQITRRDGVVDNLEGPKLQDIDQDAYRIGVMFTPTSKISDYLLVDYGKVGGHQLASITEHAGTGFPALVYGSLVSQLQAAQDARGIRSTDNNQPDFLKNETAGFQNVLTYSFNDNYSLKYIASLREDMIYILNSETSFPIPLLYGQTRGSSHVQTHELQLHGSEFDSKLSWVAGLYYQDNIGNNDNALQVLQQPGAPFSVFNSQSSPGHSEAISEAAYAQGTYKITSQLSLTAGVRYTQDRQSAISGSISPGGVCSLSASVANVNLATCTEPQSGTFTATNYLATLDYQFTPAIMAYVTTSTGYNAGGFNQGLANDPSTAEYAPEHLTNYEAGLKAEWHVGGIPIRTNLSGYYVKYEDIQRNVVKFLGDPPISFSGIFNAAAATMYGVQLEYLARPLSFFDLSGSVGYLHTKYDKFAAVDGQADATGNTFAQAPEWTYNVSGTFHHDLSFARMVATVTYSYISSVTYTDTNVGAPFSFEPGYGLVDASVQFKNIGGRPIDVDFWGKNLTDKNYAVNISDQSASIGYVTTLYGDPRTYGVTVKYSF